MTSTLLSLLRQRSERYGDKIAFDYCTGEQEHSRLTYQELDIRARAIAAHLQDQGVAGERVLVLCPSGLDFITAMFGCFYVGAVAVPVHPPVHNRLLSRVASIVADVRATSVLTTAATRADLKEILDGLHDGDPLRWLAVDTIEADDETSWTPTTVDTDSVAFVQYTSGSTSTPKGVVLTHHNLLANLESISRDAGQGDEARVVSWLPLHHDMGLIGGIFGVVHFGGTAYLMPPSSFIQRPMSWLEAISWHGANISVGPNFGYQLCVERSTPEERATLDLSTWVRAYCGAEPVRAATMRRFTEAFAPAGFRADAFHPVYGLAEATLFVSGRPENVLPTVRSLDNAALREHRVVPAAADDANAAAVVGCGPAAYGEEIVIVDPATRREFPPDVVGEIWVAGENVAQGYLGKPSESAETFAAHLADSGRGPFLRTGDYGFLLDGELFVTGRLKDLIIIRGRNYHPNDIEATVQEVHPALMSGRGAAFAVSPDPSGTEQLVIVQEVDRGRLGEVDTDELIAAIRTAVTSQHDIGVHTVVLVDPLRIPTTSSGKIRRRTCRQRFLDGELDAFAEWRLATPRPAQPVPAADEQADEQAGAGPGAGPGADEIRAWFVAQLAGELGLSPDDIDTGQPFAYYGLDSVRAIQLMTALEAWSGIKVAPTLAYDHPTIDLAAEHLAGLTHTATSTAADAGVSTGAGRRPEHGPAPDRADEPIAIIGIGCRFPGADGPAAYWRLLREGRDAITATPPERWDTDSVGDGTRWGGFLERIDGFDAGFFGISPREAVRIDPQQRLLLEVAWEALEDAGLVPDRLAGSRTGVFTGVSTYDYLHLQLSHPELIDAYSGTGTASSIAANRLSYVFDFRGPSLTLDSACSSSLVAVHQACRSLRDGECDLALAGGVNIMLSAGIGLNFTRAGVMATDGRCKTFDARADGWVRGEGAGIVVLKPLREALADEDPIYAVIRGSAVNQDGRTNGLMAPSRTAQEVVLTDAYRRAGVSPGVVQYVEAQGIGTPVGDAIEVGALGTVLAEDRPPDSPCLIGSVKTNIGHLEAAAGIAGLIKVALALRHRMIPPTLNFTEPNPTIEFDKLPVRVAQTLTPWPDDSGRAVAGVSAFGFGGTNAHVVLAEAPQVRAAATADDHADGFVEILPLSARSQAALDALAERYESALTGGVPPADLCHTAGARRAHHDHRLAVVGASRAELIGALAAYRRGEPHPGVFTGRSQSGHRSGVVFVFSDEGSQWRGMAQRLYAEDQVFRTALAECDRALRRHMEISPLSELLADPSHSRMDEVTIASPALFAVQVALAALWQSWGVEPAAVIGHRMGEVAAAHVAGVLGLDDAAALLCGRTRLSRLASTGAVREGLDGLLANLRPDDPRIPLYSTVTGDAVTGRGFGAAHWMENLHSPVRFSAAVRRLLGRGHDAFLEISAHPMLLSAVQEDAADLGRSCTTLVSMRRGECGRDVLMTSLAALYASGHAVDWARVHPHGSHCTAAPTYPWQRQRFWLDIDRCDTGDGAGTGGTAERTVVPAPLPAPSASAAPTVDEVLLCADQRERRELLESYLRDRVAAELGVLPPLLDVAAPLSTLGIDSLTAAELRARVERDLGIVIPVAQLLNGPSVSDLAEWISTTMVGFGSTTPEPESAGVPGRSRPPDGAVASGSGDGGRWIELLNQMPEVSDDTVDELLRQLLAAGENHDDTQLH